MIQYDGALLGLSTSSGLIYKRKRKKKERKEELTIRVNRCRKKNGLKPQKDTESHLREADFTMKASARVRGRGLGRLLALLTLRWLAGASWTRKGTSEEKKMKLGE